LLLRDSSHVELRFAEANPEAIPPAVSGRRDYPVREFLVIPRDSILGFEVLRSTGGLAALIGVVGMVVVVGSIGGGIIGGLLDGIGNGLKGR
jgi:hypothetical protein